MLYLRKVWLSVKSVVSYAKTALSKGSVCSITSNLTIYYQAKYTYYEIDFKEIEGVCLPKEITLYMCPYTLSHSVMLASEYALIKHSLCLRLVTPTLSHAVDHTHFPAAVPQVSGSGVCGVAHSSAGPERRGRYHGDRGDVEEDQHPQTPQHQKWSIVHTYLAEGAPEPVKGVRVCGWIRVLCVYDLVLEY